MYASQTSPVTNTPTRDWRYYLGMGVVLTALSFNMLLISAISPVLPTIAAHFGTGQGAAISAQMIITLSGVGIMVGGPIAGWLGDRIGLKRMLVLALIAYGVFGSTGLYIESAWLLLAFRFLQGMATAGIGAATVAIVGNGFKGGTRSWLLGLQHALLAAAGGGALAIAGYVANKGGWRAPFALYLTAFVMIALVLAARFDGSIARRQDAPTRPMRDLLPMWPTFVMITALYFASYMFFLQLPFVMSGDGIKNPADRSSALLWITIAMFVSGSLYGGVIQALGRRWTLVVILALMGASCVLVGVTHGLLMASVACGLVGLGGGGLGAYVADMALWQAPPDLRGRATGFMYMSMYAGDFLNPPIVTPLRGLIGNHEAFGVVGLGLLAGAVARVVIRERETKALERRLEKRSAFHQFRRR